MPFKNNGTLQKSHITNTSSEIEKHGTHKKRALQKWHTLQNNLHRLFVMG